MNIKNGLVIVFMVIIFVPKMYSMHCLVRYLPRTHSRVNSVVIPAVQKRNFLLGDSGAHFLVLDGSSVITILAGTPLAVYASYRVAYRADKYVAYTRYKNDAYAYVEKCLHDDSFATFTNHSLKNFDDKEGGRSLFLFEMHKRYDQLSFVESLEVDALLRFKKKNAQAEKHAQLIDTAFEQKQRIYNAVCVMEKDIQKQQQERFVLQPKVNAASSNIDQKFADQLLQELIVKIKVKHQGSYVGLKQLTDKE